MTNPESLDFRNPESHSEEELRIIAKKRGKNVLSGGERIELEQEKAKIIERSRERQRSISGLQTLIDGQGEEEEYIIPTSDPEPVEPEPREDLTSEDQSPESKTQPESETTHRAKIEYIKKKPNKNVAFRNFMSGVAVVAVASILGASIPTNGFGLLNKNKTAETAANSFSEALAYGHNQDSSVESRKGVKDGYGEPGLYLSEHKDHDYDYGDAKKVGEICDHDEVEMLKYTADNQVESLADYMAELPEDLCPEGFYGLKPRDIEQKLENLTPDEYEKVKTQAMHALDEAFTRVTVTQYNYHHYGMQLKDPNGAVVHENMQLIDEGIGPGIQVVEFYWLDKDGNEIGSMLVNIRRTSANEKGEVNGHEGGLEVLHGGNATPTTTTGKQGDPHGGDLVDQSEQVNPGSEVNQEENGRTNEENQGSTSATPGSASTPDSSEGFASVSAPGADTSGGRLQGGEDQSGGGVAGAESPGGTDTGSQTDQTGNDNQAESRESGNNPGGDNNNNQSEESRVESGDF